MGAPVSWTGRSAAARVVEWRPSQPTTRAAWISTGPLGVLARTPSDAVVAFDEAGGLVLHEEVKGGEFGGVGGEEVEEVPLRHEGDELCVGGEMGEVGRWGSVWPPMTHGEAGDLLVRECEELVEEAELVEELERGGMDGVAAEVAEEVFVLFEHGDVDAGAGEEEAEHDAGGASADDAAGGLEGCGVGGCHGVGKGSKGLRWSQKD